MSNNQITVASFVLAELPPSAIALHAEAVEFFANGGTIGKAASTYAGASDTFYHRAIVWVISSGFHLLPADAKGNKPKVPAMATISEDSKNHARAMAQEIYSLAWQAHEKGIDPLAFASLRSMRDSVRAKNKTLPNDTVNAGIISSETAAPDFVGPVEQVGEGAETFHRVSSADVAAMLQEREVLAMIKAELAANKPSVHKLRQLCGITA
jgi:hypothetical protein